MKSYLVKVSEKNEFVSINEEDLYDLVKVGIVKFENSEKYFNTLEIFQRGESYVILENLENYKPLKSEAEVEPCYCGCGQDEFVGFFMIAEDVIVLSDEEIENRTHFEYEGYVNKYCPDFATIKPKTKSSMLEEISKKLDIPVISIKLAEIEKGEFCGIPRNIVE